MQVSLIAVVRDVEAADRALKLAAEHGMEAVIACIGVGSNPIALPPNMQARHLSFDATMAFTEAASLAVRASSGDAVLLVSGHTLWAIEHVSGLVGQLQKYQQIAAVAAIDVPTLKPTPTVPFFGTVYRKAVLRKLGYFDSTVRDVAAASKTWAAAAIADGWKLFAHPAQRPADEEIDTEPPPLPHIPDKFLESLVTVAIPYKGNNIRALKVCVDLWRAQSPVPAITIHDYGSPPEIIPTLLSLERPGVEVHLHRLQGNLLEADQEAVAIGAAMEACRTKFFVVTQVKALLLVRTVIAELTSLCGPNQPVVAYTKTKNPILDRCMAIFHMPTMDRLRASWNLRWLRETASIPISPREELDVEAAISQSLKIASVEPRWLGAFRGKMPTAHFDWLGASKRDSLTLAEERAIIWASSDAPGKRSPNQRGANAGNSHDTIDDSVRDG